MPIFYEMVIGTSPVVQLAIHGQISEKEVPISIYIDWVIKNALIVSVEYVDAYACDVARASLTI